ncbi:MAG: MATE family efflux transporter [Nitrosopumilus sp.]|nr:MATE family efflux transporter [Nitrosopumilus sp.]MDH3489502.1 MATE family efflux transporter [Nitrosopumilus sp.]MDH3516499.1 MATE family efflux transporter [Nitrosopumilus sp.]MDH3564966.1 MATE family efflux transporter [Nitrosopumilus sp.]MDH5416389.1 MATE family efflux transporter [Nitrosopumilus sp.]
MEKIFAEGKVSKVFVKFAIPAILTNLLTMSAFFIDGILIGQFIGLEGLAAVNLVFPVFIMIGATGIIVASGSSALVGKYLGQDNKTEAKHVFNLALALCIILSIIISSTVLIFVDDITGLLGATGSLYELTREYFSVILIFFGLILTSFVLEFFIRNVGDSIFPIKSTGIASVVNVVLTYVFLTVFDMGLAGAAWATGISFTSSIIILATYFLRKKLSLSYGKPVFKIITIKKILHNGVSESLSEFSSGSVILIFNLMLLQFIGEIGVAAFAIISFISLMMLMVNFGFSMALQPMVSYNYGAKLAKRVTDTLKIAITISTAAGIVFYFIVLVFGEYVVGLFVNNNQQLSTISLEALQIYGLSYIFIGINILASAYLTALEKPKLSLLVALSYSFIFAVIGLVIFPQILGVTGIWWAIPFANIVSIFVSVYMIKRSNRKLILQSNS